jgi:SAPK-interacting protein 1 (Sin1), Pleckstrin-homology
MMKKHERILTIDGEHLNIVAVEGKNFFDIGKSANSFHVSAVQSCKRVDNTAAFKLLLPGKQFDLEASTPQEASINN